MYWFQMKEHERTTCLCVHPFTGRIAQYLLKLKLALADAVV